LCLYGFDPVQFNSAVVCSNNVKCFIDHINILHATSSGTMVQCDSCLYWLHSDCIDPNAGNRSTYFCEFCEDFTRKTDANNLNVGLNTSTAFRDVILRPQPDFRLPHCVYYRALMCSEKLQIRIGEKGYVLNKNIS